MGPERKEGIPETLELNTEPRPCIPSGGAALKLVNIILPPACEFTQSAVCRHQLWSQQDRRGTGDRSVWQMNKGVP